MNMGVDGKHLHWKICKHYHLPHAENWYEHKPLPALESEKCDNTDSSYRYNEKENIESHEENSPKSRSHTH